MRRVKHAKQVDRDARGDLCSDASGKHVFVRDLNLAASRRLAEAFPKLGRQGMLFTSKSAQTVRRCIDQPSKITVGRPNELGRELFRLAGAVQN